MTATTRAPDGNPISLSFGWAQWPPGGDLDEALRQADNELLERKRRRREATASLVYRSVRGPDRTRAHTRR